jgi:transcriptional regulator of NAD metabolism
MNSSVVSIFSLQNIIKNINSVTFFLIFVTMDNVHKHIEHAVSRRKNGDWPKLFAINKKGILQKLTPFRKCTGKTEQ